MIAKLLPVIFLVAGLGAGIGAGVFLAPGKSAQTHAEDDAKDQKPDKTKDKAQDAKGEKDKSGKDAEFEYLKLTKQFVVPVLERDEIAALVTLSVSLEAKPGISEAFYAIEPKLRDGFLQVLFDHANTGGFAGVFTESDNLDVLKRSLLEVAKKSMGDDVSRVLIMSVSRQST